MARDDGMGSADPPGKPPAGTASRETAWRESSTYGPKPLGALLPGVTRTAFRRRSPGSAQVLADWPEIVGPALAACCSPRRLAAGTLTLACEGPIALELQHVATALIERINTHLGSRVVERLRFQQEVLNLPPLVAPRRAAVPVEVPGLPDGALREALGRLGGAMRARRQRQG